MNFLGIKQVVAINSILKINFLYHLFIFFTELWVARKIKPNTRGLCKRVPGIWRNQPAVLGECALSLGESFAEAPGVRFNFARSPEFSKKNE